MGFRVWGSMFGVWCLEFEIWGPGFRDQGLVLGFRVYDLGFGDRGFGFWV